MTKKPTTQPSSSKPPIAGRTEYGLGLLILLLALAIFSQLTGVDLVGILTGTLTPTPTPPPLAVSPTPALVTPPPGGTPIANADASVYVLFSAPTGSRDPATYRDGPDTIVAADIAAATRTVDVAAFELNSPAIASALLAAHQRGVRVRIVTDNLNGLDVAAYRHYLAAPESKREAIADKMETPPDETLLDELYDAGIMIVDDGRQALMHNKFVIIDGTTVWTGSMNLTVNCSYRNNNNFIRVRSQRMVADYQTEFNEMFERRLFGPRSTGDTPYPQFSVDGIPFEVYFAPEDQVIAQLVEEVRSAETSIKFLAFSFTEDALGAAVLDAAARGVKVQGVFETTGSLTEYSELSKFYCAGLDVRQDGNPFVLHHKVIILDDYTVVIGSFNFSGSATAANDENLVIIHDAGIAAQYLQEYERRLSESRTPQGVTCPAR